MILMIISGYIVIGFIVGIIVSINEFKHMDSIMASGSAGMVCFLFWPIVVTIWVFGYIGKFINWILDDNK